jgi:hypothetical protein
MKLPGGRDLIWFPTLQHSWSVGRLELLPRENLSRYAKDVVVRVSVVTIRKIRREL